MNHPSWPQLIVAVLIFFVIVWYGMQPARPYPSTQVSFSGSDRTATVLVGGDVNMGRKIGQQILHGDVDYPFAKISDTLKDADITFVNLESQLADLGGETQSPTNEYRFAGPPEAAKTLKNAGIDIVSVANNHMWDYGKDALAETIAALDANGVAHAGAGMSGDARFAPAILESHGIKIAFLAMTTRLNGYEKYANDYVSFGDPDAIIAEIDKLRDKVDFIFVSIHTGTEYKNTPNDDMIGLSHKLIDAGADGIIGHHPHVPQPIEIYNGKPIFYSLGNFAFWQPFSFWTQHSYLAKMTLRKGKPITYEIIPAKAGWQPEVETSESAISQILDLLNSKL